MTVIPIDRFDAAMDTFAAQMRRNTHIIVARNEQTGEALSRHARPRGEAIEYRNAWQRTLGDEWTVRVVRVRTRRVR